jgi:hypothetical protein
MLPMAQDDGDLDSLVRKRIRALRVAQGWSLEELAARARLSQSTLSRIENGQRRLREKAEATGVAGRVRIVQADLDADWPDLGTPDLVWASASMHHMADPDRTLRKVTTSSRPAGCSSSSN